MKLHKFKIEPGQEIMETLTKEFEERQLTEGAITIIGACDECEISNMPRKDAKKDIITKFDVPMEMSGTGEIREGKPHIHCTLSAEGNAAIHGHLHSAHVRAWYISVFVMTP